MHNCGIERNRLGQSVPSFNPDPDWMVRKQKSKGQFPTACMRVFAHRAFALRVFHAPPLCMQLLASYARDAGPACRSAPRFRDDSAAFALDRDPIQGDRAVRIGRRSGVESSRIQLV